MQTPSGLMTLCHRMKRVKGDREKKKKPRHANVNKSESAFVDGVKVQAAPPRYTICNAILTRPLADTKRVIIHLNLPTK